MGMETVSLVLSYINFEHPFVYILTTFIITWILTSFYWYQKIKKFKKQAIKQSKSVIIGQVTEQIAPLLKNFPYNPKDMVFLGKGVDYIVIKDLHKGNPSKIIFVEIKTWKGQLNQNEIKIKNLIDSKKVEYKLIRL